MGAAADSPYCPHAYAHAYGFQSRVKPTRWAAIEQAARCDLGLVLGNAVLTLRASYTDDSLALVGGVLREIISIARGRCHARDAPRTPGSGD